MSEAFECDRCGGLHSGEPANTLRNKNRREGVPVKGDPHLSHNGEWKLCDDCSLVLKGWLRMDNGFTETNKP